MASKDIINCLISKHYKEVRSYLGYFRRKPNEWKDDVMQESCIKVFKAYKNLKEPEKFLQWFKSIAIRTGLNKLRDEKKEKFNMPLCEKIKDTAKTPEEMFYEEQCLGIIYDEIALLPSKQQRAFIERFINEEPFSKIAEEMNCPYDTAKANYRHAMLKFNANVKKFN